MEVVFYSHPLWSPCEPTWRAQHAGTYVIVFFRLHILLYRSRHLRPIKSVNHTMLVACFLMIALMVNLGVGLRLNLEASIYNGGLASAAVFAARAG